MKGIFFLSIFLLSLSPIFGAAPQITLNSIEPSPVQPGQDLTIQIKLTNNGNDEITLGRTDLSFGDSFILKSDDQSESKINLCSSCSRTITFFLSPKSDLESGFYTIKVTSQYDGSLSVEEDFSVQVSGLPNLVLNVANELDILPEAIFNLDLELKNEGTGLAKNIKITPGSNDIGLLDENFLFQRTLNVNSQQTITGKFLSSSEIKSGYFLLPVTLSYEDSQNNFYTVEETIGLEIKDKANIILQHLELDTIITKNTATTLSLRLENDGVGKAKNVKINLDGEILGQKEAFFGSINKGEDLPFIFSITPQKEGNLPIGIVITYEDDFGVHTHSETIDLEVSSKSNLNIIVGIILIILLVVGVIIKRR
jgi:hypothetical protein